MAKSDSHAKTLKHQQRCEIFADEFVVSLNISKAAEKAGFSEKTAASQGSRLLKNVEVQKMIQERMNARAKRTEITADRVLKELFLIATTDLALAYDEKGSLKAMKDIPEEIRRAIAGVDVFDEFDGYGQDRQKIGEVRKLKLWDKPRALELLGRHLKLFADELKVTVSLEDLVAGSQTPATDSKTSAKKKGK